MNAYLVLITFSDEIRFLAEPDLRIGQGGFCAHCLYVVNIRLINAICCMEWHFQRAHSAPEPDGTAWITRATLPKTASGEKVGTLQRVLSLIAKSEN